MNNNKLKGLVKHKIDLDGIVADLNTTDGVAKMVESVYVDNFEPYFTGAVELEPESDVIARWIEYAGGPRRPVHIIDDDGAHLYIIPGLLKNTPRPKMEIHRSFDNYSLVEDRSKEAANQMLGSSLSELIDATVEKKEVDPIFKRGELELDDIEEDYNFVIYE